MNSLVNIKLAEKGMTFENLVSLLNELGYDETIKSLEDKFENKNLLYLGLIDELTIILDLSLSEALSLFFT